MISIQTFCINVSEVGEIFMRHRINAKVSSNEIIVYAEHIPREVLKELLSVAKVTNIRNFEEQPQTVFETKVTMSAPELKSDPSEKMEEAEKADAETAAENSVSTEEEPLEEEIETIDEDQYASPMEVVEEVHEKAALIAEVQERKEREYERRLRDDDIPKYLMRGQVYKWGEIRGYEDEREGSIKSCVIIVQNDYDNSMSDDTIALFCTSEYERRSQVHCNFRLYPGNLLDYSQSRLRYFDNCTLFSSRIIGVNRSELGRYLGTLSNGFMNELQSSIDYCIGLKRSRDVNWAQLDILSKVDVEKLYGIAKSDQTNKEKVRDMMLLFGFDRSKNGVSYIESAILKAVKLKDYRMGHLATLISDEVNVDEREVERLMVARIKEHFQVRFSPAISFIRLMVSLLKKG